MKRVRLAELMAAFSADQEENAKAALEDQRTGTTTGLSYVRTDLYEPYEDLPPALEAHLQDAVNFDLLTEEQANSAYVVHAYNAEFTGNGVQVGVLGEVEDPKYGIVLVVLVKDDLGIVHGSTEHVEKLFAKGSE